MPTKCCATPDAHCAKCFCGLSVLQAIMTRAIAGCTSRTEICYVLSTRGAHSEYADKVHDAQQAGHAASL